MALRKDPAIPGKDHFQQLYQQDLCGQAEWLQRGAIEKANSIEVLLRAKGIRPKTLVDLGCGTGAVIIECQRRNLAENYIAIDYSSEAIEYLKQNSSGIQPIVADISDPSTFFPECDVLILSHVIEHLEHPQEFLRKVHNFQFSYLIAEVPLEDLPGGKLKALFSDRTRNSAGHVQFFTAKSFRQLLMSGGFRILEVRRFVPILDSDTINLVCKQNEFGLLRQIRMKVTAHYLLPLLSPVWSQVYYAHFAALCEKAK